MNMRYAVVIIMIKSTPEIGIQFKREGRNKNVVKIRTPKHFPKKKKKNQSEHPNDRLRSAYTRLPAATHAPPPATTRRRPMTTPLVPFRLTNLRSTKLRHSRVGSPLETCQSLPEGPHPRPRESYLCRALFDAVGVYRFRGPRR